jgi:RsiW-degrading membrane proteinase PrsW (M82 family)
MNGTAARRFGSAMADVGPRYARRRAACVTFGNVWYLGQDARMALPRPDPERNRRIVGGVIYSLFMLGGLVALVFFFLVLPLMSDDPGAEYVSMAVGAACAIPPLVIYLWIPRLIDRYDPEPAWALALVFAWGAIAACGVACTINTGVETVASAVGGSNFGEIAGACISAPIVEEGMKGMAVFGVFFFLKREFDGVVDGVIYATFAALGFAATENIIYYANAVKADPAGSALATTFLVRGILAPWGHPLYTSMTGIGFGIARETTKTWLKWMAPIGGYCAAMFLHCTWNTASTISGFLFLLMLPLWILFVLAFIGILIWLVVRKGRIIRNHLQDEVLLGTITKEELDLVCSPFGGLRASFGWGGSAGRRFVKTVARLGLSKWHTGRALQGRNRTVSADWIVPLRQEIGELRTEVSRSLGRPLPLPQAWTAPPAQHAQNLQPGPAQGPYPGYPPVPPPGGWGGR